MNSFESFCNEIFLAISSRLNVNDIMALGATCKTLRPVCNQAFKDQYPNFDYSTQLDMTVKFSDEKTRNVGIMAAALIWPKVLFNTEKKEYRGEILRFLCEDLDYKPAMTEAKFLAYKEEHQIAAYLMCKTENNQVKWTRSSEKTEEHPINIAVKRCDALSLSILYEWRKISGFTAFDRYAVLDAATKTNLPILRFVYAQAKDDPFAGGVACCGLVGARKRGSKRTPKKGRTTKRARSQNNM